MSPERTLTNELDDLPSLPTIISPLKVEIPAVNISISAFVTSIEVEVIVSAVTPPVTVIPLLTSTTVLNVEIPLLTTSPPEFTERPAPTLTIELNVETPDTIKKFGVVAPTTSKLTVEIPLTTS